MGIFNSLSRLFDENERQFDSIFSQFDRTMSSLSKHANSLLSETNDLMKQIKDGISDFKLIVPFNEGIENFKYEIKDGVLTVKVEKSAENSNSFHQVSTTIPSNCKVDELDYHINKKDKTLVITIPKDIKNDENLKKFTDTAINKLKEAKETISSVIKENANKVAQYSSTPRRKSFSTSKTTKAKIVRDEKGRFVSSDKLKVKKSSKNEGKK